MPKIKNVVFDFGQVMVHYEPDYIVKQFVSDKEDAALLSEVVFDRLYWDKIDEGTMTDGELLAAVRTRLPERLHEIAEKVYFSWIYNIPEREGMRELAERIRDEYGVRLLLLSNISMHFIKHADEIPVLSIFEKCIFSAEVGHVKPNRDMYEYMCKTCDILPEETVFVDDNPSNIKGAEDYGIKGYLFDGDVSKLACFFEKTLCKIK